MAIPPAFFGGRLVALSILAGAVGLQFAYFDSCENAWFLTFAEKVLDGAIPYVDVSDPNTPAAWLIYLPPILLSRFAGLPAEIGARIEIFATVIATLTFSARILRGAGLLPPSQAGYFRNAGLFVFLIAQGSMLGQRDHFATVFALPMLCVYAARAARGRISIADAPAAGAIAAFAMAIKPHFALVFLLPGLYVAFAQRSARALASVENLAAAVLVIAFYLGVGVFAPAYFTIALPEITLIYAHARAPWQAVIEYPATALIAAELAAVATIATRIQDARAIVAGLAAGGFAIAYVAQAKLNPYQALPAVELAILALVFQFAAARDVDGAFAEKIGLRALAPAMAMAPVIAGVQLTLIGFDARPHLLDAVIAVAPARPVIGAITELGDLGFPLTRRIGAVWAGRQSSLWRVNNGEQVLAKIASDSAEAARVRELQMRDRTELAEDLAKGKPDVILVDSESMRRRELALPPLAHALDDYHKAAVADEVEIWLRKTHLRQAGAQRH